MRIFTGYQKGVDLGGWFSQCDHTEQRYDTFITAADFAVIRSWGCDHVRLRLDGVGDCRVYSITKTLERAEDL